jgi:hypothetical protein
MAMGGCDASTQQATWRACRCMSDRGGGRGRRPAPARGPPPARGAAAEVLPADDDGVIRLELAGGHCEAMSCVGRVREWKAGYTRRLVEAGPSMAMLEGAAEHSVVGAMQGVSYTAIPHAWGMQRFVQDDDQGGHKMGVRVCRPRTEARGVEVIRQAAQRMRAQLLILINLRGGTGSRRCVVHPHSDTWAFASRPLLHALCPPSSIPCSLQQSHIAQTRAPQSGQTTHVSKH